jgi:hypothetical protein
MPGSVVAGDGTGDDVDVASGGTAVNEGTSEAAVSTVGGLEQPATSANKAAAMAYFRIVQDLELTPTTLRVPDCYA